MTNAQLKSTIQRAKTQHKLRKKRISDTTFNSIIEFLESKLEKDK
jgi:hypothetical protein